MIQGIRPLQLAELDHLGAGERRIGRWLGYLVVLGIGLRTLLYLLRLPIWTDEAKLATSLLDRGYAGLLEPLAYHQIATFLFLWIQETSTAVFGFSELSLRLAPVMAGIASVILMHRLTRRLLCGAPAAFALALFVVSYYPVRHSAELKPYATDLLASLALTVIAVEWLRDPDPPRRLWWLAAAAPAAVLLSYPAAFAAAGVLTALALPVWRQRRWQSGLALATGALLAGAAFSCSYLLIAGSQFELRTTARLPWQGGFPPPEVLGGLRWLVEAHTGRTFGYPLGGENGGSILTFIAFAVGTAVLFRARRTQWLALLLLPFAFGLAAAVMHRYPYGGSGRVSQYLVPAICLLAGLGIARLTSVARRAATRRRAQRGVLAGLVLFGLFLGVAAVLRPYRDRADMIGRDFARWFWDVKSRDGELVSGWEDLRLDFARPTDRWTPGGAGYRINQRIYSRRLRRGGAPDLAAVSREHPLRVVFLGSALAERRDSLDQWLGGLLGRYQLVGRERHELGGFAEQHGRGDWIELYTFVPAAAVAPPQPTAGGSDGSSGG